jgi:uncharacterized membrane protein YphA (DoxX/SURF4 family)
LSGLSFAALALRAVIGGTFLVHSLTFLGILSAPPGHVSGLRQGLVAFGDRLHYRWPKLMLLLVVAGEGVGAILCLSGFLLPLPCFIFALIVGQGIYMRRGHGFTLEEGYEHHLNLFVAIIALAALGAGSVSIDGMLGWNDALSGVSVAVSVAVLAVVMSVVFLSIMRVRPAPERPGRA